MQLLFNLETAVGQVEAFFGMQCKARRREMVIPFQGVATIAYQVAAIQAVANITRWVILE